MALAWEMLEMARIIYNQHGGGVAHANKLADCHMYIGDILCEQVGDMCVAVVWVQAVRLMPDAAFTHPASSCCGWSSAHNSDQPWYRFLSWRAFGTVG